MTDIQTIKTAELWTRLEQAVADEQWTLVRECLDEVGMRYDAAWERLEHAQLRGARPVPTLVGKLDRVISCYRPVLTARVQWVNRLISQGAREAKAVGL